MQRDLAGVKTTALWRPTFRGVCVLASAPYFTDEALNSFAAAYPLAPVVIRHDLAGHALMTREALSAAASRMIAAHVEARAAATAVGGPFGALHDDTDDIASAQAGWTMLRKLEELADYRALLTSILDELRWVIQRTTGRPHELRGFAFVSTPETVTPYHFDPEYNLLFQLAGTKQFAVLPAAAPCLPEAAHHALHIGGDNILSWHDSFANQAKVFVLQPGDALFVPYKCPHWVRVGDDASISLSLTWQSDWTGSQRQAHRLNARLARFGYVAPPLPAWPRHPALRAFAGRALDRLGIA